MISTCEGPGCGVITAANMVSTTPTQGGQNLNEARERRALSNTAENNVVYVEEIPYESMTPFIPIPENAWEMPVPPATGSSSGMAQSPGQMGTSQGMGMSGQMGTSQGMGNTPGVGIAQVPGTSNVPMGTGAAAAEISSGQGIGMSGQTGTSGQGIGTTLGIGQGQGASVGSMPSEESVFENAPTFTVPNNPLLPPGYQEVMDYGNLQYMNGFLRTQIGKYVRIQQLIGASVIEDRFGYLVGVGINYILLQEISTGNILALDFWNIKYVYVYYTKNDLPTNSTV